MKASYKLLISVVCVLLLVVNEVWRRVDGTGWSAYGWLVIVVLGLMMYAVASALDRNG